MEEALTKSKELPSYDELASQLFEEEDSKVELEVGYVSPLSKHDWIERGRKIWGLEDDAAIRKHPIVASCGSLSHEDSVSEFYTWLNGVALAAKIAAKYSLSQFFLYVPTVHMYTFISSIWNPYYRGSVSLRKSSVESLCFPEDGDIEKIYRLTLEIMSYLNRLSVHGVVKYFAVQPVSSPRNKAAEFLSKLSVDKEDMKFAEICRNERLSDILYDDVVGKHFYF